MIFNAIFTNLLNNTSKITPSIKTILLIIHRNMSYKLSCKCHKKDCIDNLEEYIIEHHAEAMVLTCIDYRFVDIMANFLERQPTLAYKFDLTALAGASLGYNQTKFEAWPATFIDQVKLAIDLHHIRQLIVFDHMDCGAYQLFYPDIESNSEEERLLHIKNIKLFIRQLRKLFPDLIYSGYLINVDATIDTIVKYK